MSFSPLDSQLLGKLFTTESMRAVFSERHFITCMLRVEEGLARAQATRGLVPEELAQAIGAFKSDEFDLTALATGTAQAGTPTIPFVKMVQAKLPTELESGFHLGTTTQDIADTALVLQIKDGLDLIEADLKITVENLANLAERHKATCCVGRTASQHAAPITFGYKAAVWCVAIAEQASLLDPLRRRVLVASLGGPVGTLSGMGADADCVLSAFANDLGLRPTAIAWHTQRGRIAETGAWLCILIGVLAKFATDVVSLASTDVGEVAEPHDPGRGGSSAMPHKRNPISSMMILAAHGAASPQLVALIQSMESQHERPVGAWHTEWHSLPTLFGLAAGALREARLLSEGLEIRPQRMQRNLDLTAGLLFSDAAASILAKAIGRAKAHESVHAATEAVLAGEGTLKDRLEERHPELSDELAPAFDLTAPTRAAALRAEKGIAYARSLMDASPTK